MFDFEKLDVYKKAEVFNAGIRDFIKETKSGNTTNDDHQVRRAAIIDEDTFGGFYEQSEELTRILFGMIKNPQQ